MKNLLLATLAVLLIGCGQQATGESPDPHEPAVTSSTGQPAGSQGDGISGTVLETFDSAGYTYMRLETDEGEIWAAIAQTPMEPGAEVAIANPMAMEDFKSTSLDRTFESIVFGALAGAPGQGGADRSRPAEARGGIEVDKAEGEEARTIAELYEQKTGLAGATVTLRGEVVKYSPGIMGRNWIHLQDGSGDAAAGTHDLTVTTLDQTAVGEIVEIRGTVVLDRDFGAGYRYVVIVEDATIRQ